jgi:hypothetical protein
MLMKKYELFCLDADDAIIRTEKFEAHDDLEASQRATNHCGDHAVELWAENHRVSTFRPSAHAPVCTWRGGRYSV